MIMPVWAGVVDMGPAKLQTVLQFTDVTVRNINPCLEDIRGLVLPRDVDAVFDIRRHSPARHSETNADFTTFLFDVHELLEGTVDGLPLICWRQI